MGSSDITYAEEQSAQVRTVSNSAKNLLIVVNTKASIIEKLIYENVDRRFRKKHTIFKNEQEEEERLEATRPRTECELRTETLTTIKDTKISELKTQINNIETDLNNYDEDTEINIIKGRITSNEIEVTNKNNEIK